MNKCPICGGDGETLYEGLRDLLVPSDTFWSLGRCLRDRIAWVSPPPSASDIEKAYISYHTHTAQAEPSLLPKAIRDFILAGYFGYADSGASRVRRWTGRILGWVPILRELVGAKILWLSRSAGRRLLDVGCGSGKFLAFMRSLGWMVQGIEPDEQAASCARQHFGVPVETGFIEESDLPEDAFDAITISHVIEHVGKPESFLLACFRMLRPGGTLVIVTPNLESMGHRIFRRNWSILEPPRHLFIFSPSSLCAFVERAGFQTVRVFTTPHGARVMWDMSQALRKTGSLGEGPDKYQHPWRLGGILYYFFEEVINMVLRNQGEEIVLISRKLGREGFS